MINVESINFICFNFARHKGHSGEESFADWLYHSLHSEADLACFIKGFKLNFHKVMKAVWQHSR